MNWKRGLLRLWAVVSVLWVVGIIDDSYHHTVQRVREAMDAGSAALTESDKKLSDILPDPAFVSANTATKQAIFNKYAPADANYSSADEATKEAIRQKFGVLAPPSIWPPIFDFAKLAFIPPLLLLALGYIGLWVGRGFRK